MASVPVPAALLAVTVAVFVALLAVNWVRTEPRAVRPGQATLDPPGDEPPAVVALVTGDWELPRRAVAATLVDLAARGHLAIERVADRTLVRPAPRRRTRALAPYEVVVLDHVEELARQSQDGEVPLAAFTRGDEVAPAGRGPAAGGTALTAWWKGFEGGVHDDARARGLSTPRWSGSVVRTLLVAAGAIAVAGAIAAHSLPVEPGDDGLQVRLLASVAGALPAAPAVAVALGLRGERDTPAGREAAARWLGYRAHLAEDVLFAEYPTAAVAVWDRHLAYGIAVGVAIDAAAGVPLGPEAGTERWSSVGGGWRRVAVRHEQWQVARGRSPDTAMLAGLATAAGATPFAFIGLFLGVGVVATLADGEIGGAMFFLLGMAVMLGCAAGGLVAGVRTIGAASADQQTGPVEVLGRVLQLYRRDGVSQVLVVDPGVVDTVPAWRVTTPLVAEVGDTVRVLVTPRLGHVLRVEVVEGRSSRAAATRAAGAAPTAASEPGRRGRDRDRDRDRAQGQRRAQGRRRGRGGRARRRGANRRR